MIAILEASRAGLFSRDQWARNVLAGATVGIVALPLAMAFAIASGATPGQGLVTAIVGGFIVSVFGGTRLQIAGPTGAFVVILAGITAKHGIDGLLIATSMAGVMLILFGIARFGGVLRFIPSPVIVGFTAGIGVVIFVGQWKDFLGLPAPAGDHFHQKLMALCASLPGAHPATIGLAFLGLAIAIAGPRIPGFRRVPAPLLAMMAVTLIQEVFVFPGVATIASAFGGIPSTISLPSIPALSFERIAGLLPSAFTIAMLGAIESLLSAVVADGIAGTRHDPNQELIGQGLANLVLPVFGGFAATGAIARTATNARNGATGPLAGIVHSLTLLLILLLLAPLAGRVPLCALAAILFVVAWNMSDAGHLVRMFRTAPRADVVVLLVTFVLTVFVDLVVAVNVGVILSMLLFLQRMAGSVEVLRVDEAELGRELGASGAAVLPDGILVFAIDGPFFFGAVENLERALAQTRGDPHCLILRLRRVPFVDITGIQSLEAAVKGFERRKVRVLLCEARPNVLRKLVRAGLVGKHSAPARYFRELAGAIAATQVPTVPQQLAPRAVVE